MQQSGSSRSRDRSEGAQAALSRPGRSSKPGLRDHDQARHRARIIRWHHGDGVGPRSGQDKGPGADTALGWFGKAMGVAMG